MATCRHCDRPIMHVESEGWVDPKATGENGVWRTTCERHDTFEAEHEPAETPLEVTTAMLAGDAGLSYVATTIGGMRFVAYQHYDHLDQPLPVVVLDITRDRSAELRIVIEDTQVISFGGEDVT